MIRFSGFLVAFSGLLFPSAFAVAPNKPPVFIDAQMTRHDFVTAESAAERDALPDRNVNIMLALPCVYVFSPDGDLLYIGTAKSENDASSTRAFLADLPASAARLTPMKEKPKAVALLEFVPEFESQKKRIVGDGHYLVYAVSLMIDGHPSKSETIPNLRLRLKNGPVDILQVRLSQ